LRDPSSVKLEGRISRLQPINPEVEQMKRALMIACCFIALVALFGGLVLLGRR
jgi:hypothetical protein